MLKINTSSCLSPVTLKNAPANVKKNLSLTADYFTKNVQNIYGNNVKKEVSTSISKNGKTLNQNFDSKKIDTDTINILKTYGKHNSAIDIKDANIPENVRLNLNI